MQAFDGSRIRVRHAVSATTSASLLRLCLNASAGAMNKTCSGIVQARHKAAAADNMTSAGIANAHNAGVSMLHAAEDRLPEGAKAKATALVAAVEDIPEKVILIDIGGDTSHPQQSGTHQRVSKQAKRFLKKRSLGGSLSGAKAFDEGCT